MRISPAGQVQLNGYTSATSYTGTFDHFIAQSSSGQILTRTPAQMITDLGAWSITGNALTSTASFGSNTNSGFGFNFLGNNVIRGGMTAFGNFAFGQQGGTNARVTVTTGGRESAQLLLKSGGSNADSAAIYTGTGNPNGALVGAFAGSLYLEGSNPPQLWQCAVDNDDIWYRVHSNKDTVSVLVPVLSSSFVGSSGSDDLSYIRIPDMYIGKKIIDYQVNAFSTTYSAGSTTFQLQQNATNLTSVSFGTGTTSAVTGGISATIAASDLFTLDTGADTATGTLTGLHVILIIEK